MMDNFIKPLAFLTGIETRFHKIYLLLREIICSNNTKHLLFLCLLIFAAHSVSGQSALFNEVVVHTRLLYGPGVNEPDQWGRIESSKYYVQDVEFSSDGSFYVIGRGYRTGVIEVFSTESGDLISSFPLHINEMESSSFLNAGSIEKVLLYRDRFIITLLGGGYIFRVDMISGEKQIWKCLESGDKEKAIGWDMWLLPEGKILMMHPQVKDAYTYDIASGKMRSHRMDHHITDFSAGIYAEKSVDEDWRFTEKNLTLREYPSGKQIMVLPGVSYLSRISPDGSKLLKVGGGEGFEVISIPGGEVLMKYTGKLQMSEKSMWINEDLFILDNYNPNYSSNTELWSLNKKKMLGRFCLSQLSGHYFDASADRLVTFGAMKLNSSQVTHYRLSMIDLGKLMQHEDFWLDAIFFQYELEETNEGFEKNWLEGPPVADIDGNIYSTIWIGRDLWMAMNLAVTRYRNKEPIDTVDGDAAWKSYGKGAVCVYENNYSNAARYGLLYNGYAVRDRRGLCPEGWHVATRDEWDALVSAYGGEELAGGALKTTGNTRNGDGPWFFLNYGASNASGFSALPGGQRSSYTGGFAFMGNNAYYWTSGVIFFQLDNDRKSITSGGSVDESGFSVRCVRNH